MNRSSPNQVLGRALLLGAVIGVPSEPATAQQMSAAWGRSDRVVVYSPHFDQPNRAYEPLDCPAQPMRLFGFEGPAADAPTELRVRVLEYRIYQPEFIRLFSESAVVRLRARMADSGMVALPVDERWAVRVDQAGVARFRAPAGVYELSIEAIGFGHNVGVVRVRKGATDSLHAFIHSAPIC